MPKTEILLEHVTAPCSLRVQSLQYAHNLTPLSPHDTAEVSCSHTKNPIPYVYCDMIATDNIPDPEDVSAPPFHGECISQRIWYSLNLNR